MDNERAQCADHAHESHSRNIRTLLADLRFRMFYGAPALIIVLATSQQRQGREDACLAAQTLMLDARECQLGTCWIGLACPWLDSSIAKSELGIPGDYTVVAPITLGFPTNWPAAPGRRPPQIHWADAEPEVAAARQRSRAMSRPKVARPLSGEEQAELFEAFGACDADGNGRMDFLEFSRLLEGLGSEEPALQHRRQFEAIDSDQDGCIVRHEFPRW
jgi:hypothetical protein